MDHPDIVAPPPPPYWRQFEPKLLTALRSGYGIKELRADLTAGLTVAIVALPLAMALAIASGSTPDKGLLTAGVAGLLISALGGSRFQIGGPTGAFVVVVFNIIAQQGIDGLILATVIAGLLLVVAGLARLGDYIRYIPEPVVAGFTGGIAIIIASSQVRDLFGLSMAKVPADFLAKWGAMWAARDSVTPLAVSVGFGALAAILLIKRFAPRFPAYLIAVVAAAVAVAIWKLPVETVGSRFGHLPAGLPAVHLPLLSWPRIRALIPSAFTIAFLAGIESLLSAMVADGMTGRRHRPNAELIAQGIANLASGLFGGLPATGAIARTATNIRAGGRTPVAGIAHAVFVLAFLVAGAPLAGFVPLASLAAILVVVSWDMSEPHKIIRLMGAPMGDRVVLMSTLGLTVLVDLPTAIGVGVVLASMIFMHNMAGSAALARGGQIDDAELDLAKTETREAQRDSLPPGVEVFQLRGPLFFGAASTFADLLETIDRPPRAIILRMSRMPVMDATGVSVLNDFIGRCRRDGVRVILSGVRDQPRQVLERMGLGPGADGLGYAADYAEAVAMAR